MPANTSSGIFIESPRICCLKMMTSISDEHLTDNEVEIDSVSQVECNDSREESKEMNSLINLSIQQLRESVRDIFKDAAKSYELVLTDCYNRFNEELNFSEALLLEGINMSEEVSNEHEIVKRHLDELRSIVDNFRYARPIVQCYNEN